MEAIFKSLTEETRPYKKYEFVFLPGIFESAEDFDRIAKEYIKTFHMSKSGRADIIEIDEEYEIKVNLPTIEVKIFTNG